MKSSKKKLIIFSSFLVAVVICCFSIYNVKNKNNNNGLVESNKLIENYARANNYDVGEQKGYNKMFRTIKELKDSCDLIILAKVNNLGEVSQELNTPHIMLNCDAKVCNVLYGNYKEDTIQLKQIIGNNLEQFKTVFPMVKENKILKEDNYYLLFLNKSGDNYVINTSPQNLTNLSINNYNDKITLKIDNENLPINGMKFNIKNITDIFKY